MVLSAFAELRSSLDVLAALRAKLRISTALGDPYEPRPSETWSVDLEKNRFVFKAGEEVLFAGPCRLLATGNANGFSFEPIRDLTPTLRAGKLAMTLDDAELVANALAVRAGFTGAFVARRGEAIDLIAIDITGPASEGVGREPWCTSCGRLKRTVEVLVAGPEGMAVCNECAELLRDVLDEDPPESGPGRTQPSHDPPPEDFSPVLSYCLLCGDRKGRLIMASEMGLCRDCAAAVIDACGQDRS